MKILSIIIPMYNMEKYIPRCLNSLVSIKSELLHDLEILVINDGSVDRSLEIAEVYHAKYPDSVRVVDKKNGNYGSCINRGLQEATGRYIKVLDADDSFDSSGLEQIVSFLQTIHSVDMVVSDYYISYSDRVKKDRITFRLPSKKVCNLNEDKYIRLIYGIQMHAIIFRTQMLIDMHYKQTEGISYTDQEWCFFPLMHVKTMLYVDVPLYDYFMGRPGQTMSPESLKKTIDHVIKVANNMLEKYIQLDKAAISQSKYYYLRHRIVIKYKDIYRLMLIHFDEVSFSKVKFKSLDKFIKEKSPQIFRLVGLLSVYKRTLPIPHVLLYRWFGLRIYNLICRKK